MQTEIETQETHRSEPVLPSWRDVRDVGLLAAGSAAVTWVVATQAAGVELVVGAGEGRQHVGVASVVVATLVAAYAGGGLLRVLARRTPRGRRTWTAIALVVLAVSLTGPLGAASLPAGLVLAALHLEVGAVVVVSLRRRAACARAERVA